MPIATAPPVPKTPAFLGDAFADTVVPLVDFAVGFSVGTDGSGGVLGLPRVDELLGGAGGETAGGEEVEGTEGGGGDNVDAGGDFVTGGGAD